MNLRRVIKTTLEEKFGAWFSLKAFEIFINNIYNNNNIDSQIFQYISLNINNDIMERHLGIFHTKFS